MNKVKAQFYVDEVENVLMKAETDLTEAHSLAEKPHNKAILEETMAGIEASLNKLREFRD